MASWMKSTPDISNSAFSDPSEGRLFDVWRAFSAVRDSGRMVVFKRIITRLIPVLAFSAMVSFRHGSLRLLTPLTSPL